MAFIPAIGSALAATGLFGLAGVAASKLLSGGSAPPSALPSATRDDAAAIAARDDELSRRKGAAADILNGSSGAQPVLTGGKLVLGS